jgi:hypothetical protein
MRMSGSAAPAKSVTKKESWKSAQLMRCVLQRRAGRRRYSATTLCQTSATPALPTRAPRAKSTLYMKRKNQLDTNADRSCRWLFAQYAVRFVYFLRKLQAGVELVERVAGLATSGLAKIGAMVPEFSAPGRGSTAGSRFSLEYSVPTACHSFLSATKDYTSVVTHSPFSSSRHCPFGIFILDTFVSLDYPATLTLSL